MGLVADYLQKQPDFNPRIVSQPQENLGFIVVIPCNNEEDLMRSIKSLWQCKRPTESIEVIVVINSAREAENSVLSQNEITAKQINDWQKSHSEEDFTVHLIIQKNIPWKYAGPGLARKIGMDEAVFRFTKTKTGKGIICSLDADTICDSNYFSEIEKRLNENPEIEGGTIYFEHPTSGDNFSEEVYMAASLYELNMRYYLQALRSTGYPYAHHALGSAFFVSSEAYVRSGGMNKRKGGEDFYFLQKVIPNISFIDLLTTRVIPSPRQSDRVPFGTGPWITRFVNKEVETYSTYNYKAFVDLRTFFSHIERMYCISEIELNSFYQSLPVSIKSFISENECIDKLNEIRNNSSNPNSFRKRFFGWFTGFKIIKYLNFIHQRQYARVDVFQEAKNYMELSGKDKGVLADLTSLLMFYRELERKNN